MMCSCRIFISCLWRRQRVSGLVVREGRQRGRRASDAPQGSWLEGGWEEAEGRDLQEFFATELTLLRHAGVVGRSSGRTWKKFTHLSIELPIQLSEKPKAYPAMAAAAAFWQ